MIGGLAEIHVSPMANSSTNNPPCRIAILGWGSLVWDARGLPRQTGWKRGGPHLAIEFSRVSKDGRLTLVLDPANGDAFSVEYCESPRTNLHDALCDLSAREASLVDRIGFVDANSDDARCRANPSAEVHLRDWSRCNGYDFVIWTDLKSNFERKLETPFSVEHAIEYLESLTGAAAESAQEYIAKAPDFVDTPLLRALSGTSWLTH